MAKKASRRSKKTTLAFIVLLSILAISLTGWIYAESKPKSSGFPPEGIYSWTNYFRGYQAYLDQRIFLSIYHGNSMSPTFSENDSVLWVKTEMNELKVGDIIIFRHPAISGIDNVVHRIVEIQTDGGTFQFRTKGDNFSSSDRYFVPEANVHGLVIGVIYHDNLR